MIDDSISTRNMYWGDPEKFDLAKMREQAYLYSRGDQINKPQNVIIHHHNHEVPCNFPKEESKYVHDTFAAVIGEEK